MSLPKNKMAMRLGLVCTGVSGDYICGLNRSPFCSWKHIPVTGRFTMENLQTIFFCISVGVLRYTCGPKVACHTNWFVFPSFSQLYHVLRMGFSS